MIDHLLRPKRKAVRVKLDKPTSIFHFGILLRCDAQAAVLSAVDPELPAASCLEAYDELLSVGGQPCKSAAQAIQLIRDAPAGEIELVKLLSPPALAHSARAIQIAYRAHSASVRSLREASGVVRYVLSKPERTCRLGVSFSPEWRAHSILARVDALGMAHPMLHVGDLLRSVNGVTCSEPAQTARLLRESVGRVELLLVPQPKVDLDNVRAEELNFIDQALAASTGSLASTNEHGDAAAAVPDDECAVCFQLLCEPVRWPGGRCHHYFCKPCTRQLAGHSGRNAPSCPLCRAPACTELTPRTLVVDDAAAALIQGRHPQEYARVLTVHRELSIEWGSRPLSSRVVAALG